MSYPKDFIDALALAHAKELPLRIVVADSQVEWFRKAYGDAAIIIPLSETMLPITGDTEGKSDG